MSEIDTNKIMSELGFLVLTTIYGTAVFVKADKISEIMSVDGGNGFHKETKTLITTNSDEVVNVRENIQEIAQQLLEVASRQ